MTKRLKHPLRRALALSVALVMCATPVLAARIEASLNCTQLEHTHTDDCYVTEEIKELTCTAEGHVHSDSCYTTEWKLTCSQPEGEGDTHVHDDNCYTTETVQACGQSEHTHDSSCYETETNSVLTCSESESSGHSHDSGCYDEDGNQTCGQSESEGHTHGSSCYETETKTVLTCSESEHTHDSSCEHVLKTLTCTESDIPSHHHDESCYEQIKTLTCTEEETHTHSEACYTIREEKKLVCTTTEHVHTAACYENIAQGTDKTLQEALADALKDSEDKDVVLILNGVELDYDRNNSNAGNAIVVNEGYKLTINDGAVSGGKIDGNDSVRIIKVNGGSVILNGGTLTNGNGNGGGAVYVANNGSFTMNGGEITGNNSQSHGGGVFVENGGEVNVNGGQISNNSTASNKNGGGVYVGANGTLNVSGNGSISNNTASNAGGGVYVDKDGKLNVSGNGSIDNNTSNNIAGGVYVGKDGKLNVSGNGSIDGNESNGVGGGVVLSNGASLEMSGGSISGNTTNAQGGGVYVNGGSFSMSGGTISKNKADSTGMTTATYPEPVGQGGGVYVQNNGTFALSGGSISGNTAGEGGGVFIDETANSVSGSFTMKGGTIDGNTATIGEGGGVYIQGTGEISKGQITNNVTYTWQDLGGGGIYIEAGGELKLTNAIITNNQANGLGGGIAACVHGQTIVYAKDGAAIYGNSAAGQGHSAGYEKDGASNGSFIDGYVLWAGDELFKSLAQDIFAAGDATVSNTQGTAGIVAGNTMLGGGDANWEGYTYCYATDPKTGELVQEDGHYILELTKVSQSNNGAVFGNRLVFLTANPDQAAIDAAVKAVEALDKGVLISGNLSANTHGGGIANNGMLQIGEESEITGTNSYRPEVNANKTLTDTATGDQKELTKDQFTFELLDKDMNPIPGASVTNFADGKTPQFSFPAEIFEKAGTYTFYVREQKGNDKTIGYDGTVYKITIVVTEETEIVKVGTKTVTVTTLTVNEPVIQQTADRNGQELDTPVTVTSIAFNNTYTEPKTPPSTPPSTPPKTPPKTPPEEPQEEVPDEDVPLANLTEEPQEDLEIPDEDVPLADVPATGDISILWYAAAVLSVCGLAAVNLFKKKENNA